MEARLIYAERPKSVVPMTSGSLSLLPTIAGTPRLRSPTLKLLPHCVLLSDPGLLDEQPIEDLDVTRIEKVWRQPPVPKAFAKPEGTNALDAKLPGPRQLRLLDTPVEGNGLAAAVSSVLTSSGAVPAATLRQQVGQHVKQHYKVLGLPDVGSAQAAKKWAEGGRHFILNIFVLIA